MASLLEMMQQAREQGRQQALQKIPDVSGYITTRDRASAIADQVWVNIDARRNQNTRVNTPPQEDTGNVSSGSGPKISLEFLQPSQLTSSGQPPEPLSLPDATEPATIPAAEDVSTPLQPVFNFFRDLYQRASADTARTQEAQNAPGYREEQLRKLDLMPQEGAQPGIGNFGDVAKRAMVESALLPGTQDLARPTTGYGWLDNVANFLGTGAGFVIPGSAGNMAMQGAEQLMLDPRVMSGAAQVAGKLAPGIEKGVEWIAGKTPQWLGNAVERGAEGIVERGIRGAIGGAGYGTMRGVAEGQDISDIPKAALEDAFYFSLGDALLGGVLKAAEPAMTKGWLRLKGYREVGDAYGINTGIYQKGYGTDKPTNEFIVRSLDQDNANARITFASKFRDTQPELADILVPGGREGLNVIRTATGQEPLPKWTPWYERPVEELTGREAAQRINERLAQPGETSTEPQQTEGFMPGLKVEIQPVPSLEERLNQQAQSDVRKLKLDTIDDMASQRGEAQLAGTFAPQTYRTLAQTQQVQEQAPVNETTVQPVVQQTQETPPVSAQEQQPRVQGQSTSVEPPVKAGITTDIENVIRDLYRETAKDVYGKRGVPEDQWQEVLAGDMADRLAQRSGVSRKEAENILRQGINDLVTTGKWPGDIQVGSVRDQGSGAGYFEEGSPAAKHFGTSLGTIKISGKEVAQTNQTKKTSEAPIEEGAAKEPDSTKPYFPDTGIKAGDMVEWGKEGSVKRGKVTKIGKGGVEVELPNGNIVPFVGIKAVRKVETQAQEEKKPAAETKQPKYGRTGNAAYKKWGTNEYVNADLDKPDNEYTKAYRKFFEFFYNKGLNGEALSAFDQPDTGDHNFPPFLEDIFHKAGVKDAEQKPTQAQEEKPPVHDFKVGDEVYLGNRPGKITKVDEFGVTLETDSHTHQIPNKNLDRITREKPNIQHDDKVKGSINDAPRFDEKLFIKELIGALGTEKATVGFTEKQDAVTIKFPENPNRLIKDLLFFNGFRQYVDGKIYLPEDYAKFFRLLSYSDEELSKQAGVEVYRGDIKDKSVEWRGYNLIPDVMIAQKIAKDLYDRSLGGKRIDISINKAIGDQDLRELFVSKAITTGRLREFAAHAKITSEFHDRFDKLRATLKELDEAIDKRVNEWIDKTETKTQPQEEKALAKFSEISPILEKLPPLKGKEGINKPPESVKLDQEPTGKEVAQGGGIDEGRTTRHPDSGTTSEGSAGPLEGIPTEDVQGTVETGATKRNTGQYDSGDHGRGITDQTTAIETKPAATDGRHTSSGGTSQMDQSDSLGTGEGEIISTTGTRGSIKGDTRLVPGENYLFTDNDQVDAGGIKTKYKNNVAALKLLKEIEAEGRLAIPDEQAVLAKYVGWGGISPALNERLGDGDEWYKEMTALKELLTEEEWESAKRSTLNAHYTAIPVLREIWNYVQRLGFKSGRILDPALGNGRFFGFMPPEIMANSRLTGVELDVLTGRIAKQLFQKADVRIEGFQNVNFPDNFFDLAISNVPFGNFSVPDPRYDKYKYQIHNYFFAKAIDKVRPGGLIVFITGSGTLHSDRDAATLREMLSMKSDLLGAVKLPNTAFKGSANTQVTTDLIILQKLLPGTSPKGESWTKIEHTEEKDKYGRPFKINEYFARNPDMMLGKIIDDPMWPGRAGLESDGRDIGEALGEALDKLPSSVYIEAKIKVQPKVELIPAPSDVKEGAFLVKDGKVYRKVEGNLVSVESRPDIVKGLIKVRDAARGLLHKQADPKATDEELKTLRSELNRVYDVFVKKHGPITKPYNAAAIKDDPDAELLYALENIDPDNPDMVKKAAIFTIRTIDPVKRIDKVDNAKEALIVSLNELGQVDLDRMAQVSNKTKDQILSDLKGLIYLNPHSNTWETKEEYLSGNVREKLAWAEEAARTEPAFNDNVEALKTIQPEDLKPEEIDAKLGAPWIPTGDIKEFVQSEILKYEGYYDVLEVTHSTLLGSWAIEWAKNNRSTKESVANTKTWGTDYRYGTDLVEEALNQRTPTIYNTLDDGKRVVNTRETLVAREQLNNIKKHFQEWLWKDKERADRLSRFYNDQYNNIVLRTYDGSHLDLPGMTIRDQQGKPIALRKHQKNGIWRIIQGGNTLLAHCVGSGKTWTMQAAGMELRRLGIAKKPMYVVPPNLLRQFVKDFRVIYPGASLLVISSKDLPGTKAHRAFVKVGGERVKESDLAFETRKNINASKRKILFNRIATGDWDGVIVTYPTFEKIPMSAENKNAFIQERLNELEEAILEMKAEKGEAKQNRLVKDLEKAKLRLQGELIKDIEASKKDIVTPFEELGIDHIFVDEADNFKNLGYTTKMNRVAGLPNSEANRALDMYMKTQYLTRANNGRGVVFATGTPIANTVAEMYTMQRYLGMDELKTRGLAHFDAWAASFGEAVTGVEMSPDGSGFRMNTRFSRFVNVPELLQMFRRFTDVQLADDLNLPTPKLKGDKPIIVTAKISEHLKAFVETLVERAEAIRSGSVNPKDDNMLKVTGVGRKAALDMRLIDPSLPADPNNKVSLMIEKVFEIWKETKDKKSAQLVFCDLSTPKGASDKIKEVDEDTPAEDTAEDSENVVIYQDIKKRLIKAGIPVNEIVFMHDAKTDAKKLALFDKVNKGQIRVLIGSTEKMGAGMNAQKKLIALHHLDAPWRPRDIEQREGRIIRQGNENKEVTIYRYVTEMSFDVFMWQTLEAKARFIAQVMRGDMKARTMENIDEFIASYAMTKALATGNPLYMEKIVVDSDVGKYQMLEGKYLSQKREMRYSIAGIPKNIVSKEEAIRRREEDINARQDVSKDKFKIALGNSRKQTTYTDREKAQETLKEIAQKFTGNRQDVGDDIFKIGNFAGFTLGIQATYTDSEPTVYVIGKSQMEYATRPVLSSMEYAIRNYPEEEIKSLKRSIAELEKDLADLEVEIKKPFASAEKLNQALAKQKELNTALGIDKPDEVVEGEFETIKTGEKKQRETLETAMDATGKEVDEGTPEGGMPMGMSVQLVGKPPRYTKKENEGKKKFKSSSETVQKHYDNSYGVRGDSLITKMKNLRTTFWNKLTREYEHLPKTGEFAKLRYALLALAKQKDVQGYKVLKMLHGITVKLDKIQYNHFEWYVLLADLMEELKLGHELPFEYTQEILETDWENINEAIKDIPEIENAIKLRKKVWRGIINTYTDTMKAIGVNVEKAFTREDYYRHQVLKYAELKGMVSPKGTGNKLRSPVNSSYLKGREGSTENINSNYLQAEYEVLSQMAYDIEVAKVIQLVNQEYNIVDKLKVEAIEINDKAMLDEFWKAINDYEQEMENEVPTDQSKVPIEIAAIIEQLMDKNNDVTARAIYRRLLNRKQAIGFDKLFKMAAEGELPHGPNGEFTDIIEAMAEHYEMEKARKKDQEENFKPGPADEDLMKDVVRLLAYLVKLRDHKAAGAAATVFKGMAEKRKYIKANLGDKFVTWRDLIPEGYGIYQPREGNVFYMAHAVPARVAERLFGKELEKYDISEHELQQVLVKGSRFREFVVKNEVKMTLENLTKIKDGFLDATVGRALRYWKIYQLIAPMRWVKYNARNLSGDAEAVFIGNPAAFRWVPQAIKELWDVFKNDKPMTKDMMNWFERGGMGATLQAQELGDIDNLKIFTQLVGKEKKPVEKIGIYWHKAWNSLKASTDFREAILRYANYLEYLDQIEKNSGRPKNFGASIPEEIMALENIEDRAYVLSNQLLGAYDQVGVVGQALRKYLIPFWSWNEVNIGRTRHLLMNACRDERIAGPIGKKILRYTGRGLPRLVLKAGMFFAKCLAFWTVLSLVNQWWHPSEEKELGNHQKSKPHIIFGRDDKGKIIYLDRLGAIQDFASWFGMDEAPLLYNEWLNGKRTPLDIAKTMGKAPINKLTQGIGPIYKQPFELAFGMSSYPDVTKPTPIRDRWEYVFNGFGLATEYKYLAGKPVPTQDGSRLEGAFRKSLVQAVALEADPGQNAYFDIAEQKRKFMDKLGKLNEGYYRSDKNSALYNFKLAIRYQDREAAIKYLTQYATLGGTKKGLDQSLNSMYPLSGLKKEEQIQFIQTLDYEDKTKLIKAMDYYEKVLKP